MNYSKPEVMVLGDASTEIRGNKRLVPEIQDPSQLQASAFELED
jgi:hypothetical protein